jgi:hypothetical protein
MTNGRPTERVHVAFLAARTTTSTRIDDRKRHMNATGGIQP